MDEMNRSLLVLWIAFCIGVLPSARAAEASCELEELLDEATTLMQAGKDARGVDRILAHALECPGGRDRYDLHFYRALAQLKLGDVKAARRSAAIARRLARHDPEAAEQTERFRDLLSAEFFEMKVRFVGDSGRSCLAITDYDEESLPEAAEITSLVPRPLHRFVASAFIGVVERERARLAEDSSDEITLVVPRGLYTLSGGRRVELNRDSTIEISDIPCAAQEVAALMSYISVLPISRGVGEGFGGRMGIVLSYQTQLRGTTIRYGGEFGLYGWGLPPGGGYETDEALAVGESNEIDAGALCSDASSAACARDLVRLGMMDAPAFSLGGLIFRPVRLADPLTLNVGLMVRLMGIGGFVLEGETDGAPGGESLENGSLSVMNARWLGFQSGPFARLVYLIEFGGMAGQAVLGLNFSGGLGAYSDSVHMTDDTLLSVKESLFSRLLFVPGIQAGASFRF